MATSFGWKKKQQSLTKRRLPSLSEAFSEESQVDSAAVDTDIDWLHNVPVKKQRLQLEDIQLKAKRLSEEGVLLAENNRYWEAINKWDEYLILIGDDEKVLDMKAQALTDLNELFPAVSAAKKAVTCNPRWWIARQTLGRALLNIGEICSAVISFQKAVHLNPDCKELWEDDLQWAVDLLNKLKEKNSSMSDEELSFHVRECMRLGTLPSREGSL